MYACGKDADPIPDGTETTESSSMFTEITSDVKSASDTKTTATNSQSDTDDIGAIATATIPQQQAQPSTTTSKQAATATTAVTSNYRLNTDLLSDIGLTRSQLEAKYGKIIKDKAGEGAYSFGFEKSVAYYYFEYGAHQRGLDEGDFPKSDEKASCITHVLSSNVFSGLDRTMSVAEVERNYGVTHDNTWFSDFDSAYLVSFNAFGYSIVIFSDINGNVKPNAYCDNISKLNIG
jgi:hypothetical protein